MYIAGTDGHVVTQRVVWPSCCSTVAGIWYIGVDLSFELSDGADRYIRACWQHGRENPDSYTSW